MVEQLKPCSVCFIAQQAGQSGVTLFEAANQMQADVERRNIHVAEALGKEVVAINQTDCAVEVCPRIRKFNEALKRSGAYDVLRELPEQEQP